MIAIIDYGAGNLFSVKNAMEYIGEKFVITSNIEKISAADGYILPGVGAFPFAMDMLKKTGLIPIICREIKTKPLLGICLGMQMLFEDSEEFSENNKNTKGLGLIQGNVVEIPNHGLKIPHTGWNELELTEKGTKSPLLSGVKNGDCVYFVHSYMAVTEDSNMLAATRYGVKVSALTCKNNVYGAQFHPEKSGEVGLQILRNFGGLVKT